MHQVEHYPTISNPDSGRFQWFFTSQGVRPLFKVIEYSYIYSVNGKPVYNLAFGDVYGDGSINDSSRSNNGDAFKVLNTVLYTVPSFFSMMPEAYVFVSGSDSQEDVWASCRITCNDHRCVINCRRQHQRIKAYSGYVRRHYPALSRAFDLFGIVNSTQAQNFNSQSFLPFNPLDDYLALMVGLKPGVNINDLTYKF